MKNRFIAFYLPQYYPTIDNNLWYGKGFTEWTNLGKSKKLFPGHYHPHVPGELGYYDLRLPEVRKAQADLAMEHGIEGFCYYHYWFGAGKMELDLPFREVLKSGEPKLPFCLCWANESWCKKFWNHDGTNRQELLVEQKYLGEEDERKHFEYCLSAFKDERYMTVDGKVLFMIYRPLKFPAVAEFIKRWRLYASQSGLKGIWFVAQSVRCDEEYEKLMELGFDGVNCVRTHDYKKHWGVFKRLAVKLCWKCLPIPKILFYKDISRFFVSIFDRKESVYPTVIPNWDHSPRSGRGGSVWVGCRPEYFSANIRAAVEAVKNKQAEHKLIFIKSWNEWGEGNYLEPDLRYGRQMLEELKKYSG